MQVTQVSDHVTHAVIGGHQSIAFGVSDDAELMNVLSKALYSDQILAVVREVLCNAWDAHVEHGCTDKPIEVSLSKEELIIRDYGTGIPFDMIGKIYGTYGGSTKKHDGKQTGGFGLGSKSPFAYGDHFEVTSWSIVDAKMTVYQMSKSNAEIGGKAGIIPVVSVPTEENGLQVKMKIQEKDHYRFDQLIQRILRNGEMNALYNGQVADVIPFGEMKHNFFITEEKMIETSQQILLRYGHVIYPVEPTAEFINEYQEIIKILDAIPNAHGQRNQRVFRIVFQAPAHRISITPSRESLSMQEHTIAAIKELLEKFLTECKPVLEKGCWDILETSVANTWLTATPKILFETMDKIPNMAIERGIDPYITDYPQFINRYASYAYPKFDGFEEKDWTRRIDALIEAGFGDKGLNLSFKKEYTLSIEQGHRYGNPKVDPKDPTKRIPTGPLVWFKENILHPVITALVKEEGMHPEKLFMYMRESEYRHASLKLFKHTEYKRDGSIRALFPWLRKVVILANNRQDFHDRARRFPVMQHWLGKVEDLFLYVVARSPKKAEQAREFWRKRGYTILDLTVAQPWEPQDANAPMVKEYISKPKRQGIPRIRSAASTKEIAGISMKLPGNETVDLISNPEFVMKYNVKSDEPNLPGFSNSISHFIIEKWGKLGGFVVNANQEAKYVAAGAKSYIPFLLEKILEELKTNPRIKESLPFIWSNNQMITKVNYGRSEYAREMKFLEAVYSDVDLYEYFGITQSMTPEDKRYLKMYKELKQEGHVSGSPVGKHINDIIQAAGTAQCVLDLFDLIRKSVPLRVMKEDETVNILKGMTKVLPQQRTLIRDTLLNAIEG